MTNKNITINHIFSEFEKLKNDKKAKEMSAYMKNKFEFLGIQAKPRKEIQNKIFKSVSLVCGEENIDFKFLDKCYKNKYREFQYAAVGYLDFKKEYLNISHIEILKKYILTKSWWDTIDGSDRIVGDIALRDKKVNEILLNWSLDENIWLRRIAIDHQLLRKEKTNTKLLEQIIINNLNRQEFFINKAIGWSLRDYSKTNPKWVKEFIKKYKDSMSNLSIREAGKYI